MTFYHFAGPFRVEQVGETFRRVLGFNKVGVVGDRRQIDARGRGHSVGIAKFGEKMLRDILGHERRHPAVFLPADEVRGVRRIDDIGGADVAGEFLIDPLEQPLRAGPLDLHRDPRIGDLERLAELFADRQVHRGIQDHLGFFFRRFHQR